MTAKKKTKKKDNGVGEVRFARERRKRQKESDEKVLAWDDEEYRKEE